MARAVAAKRSGGRPGENILGDVAGAQRQRQRHQRDRQLGDDGALGGDGLFLPQALLQHRVEEVVGQALALVRVQGGQLVAAGTPYRQNALVSLDGGADGSTVIVRTGRPRRLNRRSQP